MMEIEPTRRAGLTSLSSLGSVGALNPHSLAGLRPDRDPCRPWERRLLVLPSIRDRPAAIALLTTFSVQASPKPNNQNRSPTTTSR
jgi:hypothetical protein